MFNVDVINLESVTCLIPEGRLDKLNSNSFKPVLQFHSDKEGYLILDFTKCDYISGDGVRLLLEISKKLRAKGGSLILSSVSEEVLHILRMDGSDSMLNIFKDTQSARKEVIRLKGNESPGKEISVGKSHFQIDQIDNSAKEAMMWHKKGLAGYNELVIAAGIGSPAENLKEDSESKGVFITLGNCSGFIPFDEDQSPEFRVAKDPSKGVVFLEQALSFPGKPKCRITMITPRKANFKNLIDQIVCIPEQNKEDQFLACIIADFSEESPSISLQMLGNTNNILGAKFLLNEIPELLPEESLLEFANRTLTIQNIEGIEPIDLNNTVVAPVIWLCHTDKWIDAGNG